jgi:hypothetical protein
MFHIRIGDGYELDFVFAPGIKVLHEAGPLTSGADQADCHPFTWGGLFFTSEHACRDNKR